MTLRIDVNDLDEDRLANEAMRAGVYDAFIDPIIDAADNFQKESPVGATGDLKRAWDVSHPGVSNVTFEVEAEITNDAPAALFRIAGRGPGKLPPFIPIYRWAVSQGIPEKTHAIRRTIAKKGTRRWQRGKNWVGVRNDGTVIPGGKTDRLEQEIINRLKRL